MYLIYTLHLEMWLVPAGPPLHSGRTISWVHEFESRLGNMSTCHLKNKNSFSLTDTDADQTITFSSLHTMQSRFVAIYDIPLYLRTQYGVYTMMKLCNNVSLQCPCHWVDWDCRAVTSVQENTVQPLLSQWKRCHLNPVSI
jgi:hypothetical protein